MKRKEKRGGAREGAGRPKGSPTTTISFRVTEELKLDAKVHVPEINRKFVNWLERLIRASKNGKRR